MTRLTSRAPVLAYRGAADPGGPDVERATANSHSESESASAGRRLLVDALLRHQHWPAEAHMHLLLAQGMSLTELFDKVVQPLLDQQADRLRRGQVGSGDVTALTQSLVRLIARLPLSAVPRTRGSAVFATLPGEDTMLGVYMFATVLEHQGYSSFIVPDLPLAELVPFARSQAETPRVLVLAIQEPPADLSRLRGDVRRFRSEVPGTHVILAGRAAREIPSLPASVGAEGAAVDVGSGVRLVDVLLQPLTAREIETLRLVAWGRTNRQIATALGVAPSTVKSSLDRVFDKLHTPDRAAAAALAVRQGWID